MGLVEEHLAALKDTTGLAEAELHAVGNGSYVVKIPNFPLPKGWTRDKTTVYFVVPIGYPMANPDTFWTDQGLSLQNGATPQNTGTNHMQGIPPGLLWFSWHPGTWNPNRDNLITYARMIKRRFQEPR